MASDRAKLVLDEQSFQGLLAAAFTIQEHNARMNSDGPPAGRTQAPAQAKVAPPPKAEPSTCNQCGGPLPAADASCPNCSVPNFRPGERLQRNWASLWQMSQEQGVTLDVHRKPGSDLPLSPADPGRLPSNPVDPGRTVRSIAAPGEAALERHIQEESEDPAADEQVIDSDAGSVDRDLPREFVHARIEWPAEPADETAHTTLAESTDPVPLTDEDLGESGWADSEAETVAEAGGGRLSNLRLKLHFRRADVFLGLAVVVAAVALLWPAAGEQKPKLPPWERVLVAMGIAEAPQPVVHFHGDPNLKVWVDTHTALYYCPGDELYGKSPDGHYTTQREALADRFEPAERSVCIE